MPTISVLRSAARTMTASPRIVRTSPCEPPSRLLATLAAHLIEECGVRKGDRVALAMRNYPEWVIGFWAAWSGWTLDGMDSVIYALVLSPALTELLPKSGMTLIGNPPEKKADPRNTVDGQFSGPFVISAALVTGAMGWDSYKLLNDATIRGLLPKVTCEFDADMEAEFPTTMSGKLMAQQQVLRCVFWIGEYLFETGPSYRGYGIFPQGAGHQARRGTVSQDRALR